MWRVIAIVLCLGLSGCDFEKFNNELFGLPPKPYLTQEGIQLILEYEVGGGEPYYNRYLRYITWPGYASGLTGGVGYDYGQTSKVNILSDWSKWKEKEWREELADTSGITGQRAKSILYQYKHIFIDWELAFNVFNEVTITRWYDLCKRTYPGFESLCPNTQAAILSLTFNRGTSMSGDRRREMREIKRLVPLKDYPGIADQIDSMKRLWRGTDIERGMNRRRNAERDLVRTCIK